MPSVRRPSPSLIRCISTNWLIRHSTPKSVLTRSNGTTATITLNPSDAHMRHMSIRSTPGHTDCESVLGRHVAWTVRVTGTIEDRSLHHNPTGAPGQHVPRVWYEGRRHHDDGLASPSVPRPSLHSYSPHPISWSPRSIVARRSQRLRRVVQSCARRACQQGIASRRLCSLPVGHALYLLRGTRSAQRSCPKAMCGGRPPQNPCHQSWLRRLEVR